MSELRNRKDTSNIMILVPLLNPKFATGRAAKSCELRVRGTSGACAVISKISSRGWRRSRASSTSRACTAAFGGAHPLASRASKIVYEYFNRERVIDHVDAIFLVVLVRLNHAVRVLGAGQQRVLPWSFRRKPIKFPTSPRVPPHRVQEFRLGPCKAAIGAHCDLDHVGFTRPCSTGNRVDTVRSQGFVNTWSRDFRLELHFAQRAAHRLSIHRSPVSIIRCQPVTPKRLTYGLDARQPLDGGHSIMPGHDCAHRKSVIPRKITTIHLVGDQDFRLNCLGPGHAPSIRDRVGRKGLLFGCSAIRSFEHDLASIFRQAGTLQQSSQGHTGPFRVADCSEFPLCSLHLRDEKDTTVARAFQGRDPGLGWHASQFIVAQRKRTFDRAIDTQLIGGSVQSWCWKMAAYVEQLRRSEVGVDRIKGSLQILRLLLPNNETRRRELTRSVDVIPF